MWQTKSVRDSYRTETEDRFLILPRPSGGVLLAVADGVGGRAGGGQAAQLAIDLIAAHESAISAGDEARWASLIVYIDGEIADCDEAGQTCLVVVEATERRLSGASVGDSHAFFYPTGVSPVELTQFQQRKPFVGTGSAVPMPFTFDLPSVGGTLLMGSDGLFDYAEASAIDAAIRRSDLAEAARLLAVAARGQHSNHLYDDLTIILCRRTI